MGAVFVPKLDEGDIAMHALRVTGTGLQQSIDMQGTVEETVSRFPEVERVFSKIGTPDVATDPMPPNVADTFIILKPRADWPQPDKLKEQLIAEIETEVEKIPGNQYEFTQPIEMRFNELIAGVRADVAIEVYGDDFDQLVELAGRVETLTRGVPGAADVRMEQVTGLQTLSVEPRRAVLQRYGLNVADLQDSLQIAFGGREAGLIFEGDRLVYGLKVPAFGDARLVEKRVDRAGVDAGGARARRAVEDVLGVVVTGVLEQRGGVGAGAQHRPPHQTRLEHATAALAPLVEK